VNILRILTLNKHGDFEEVLFSSLLSYLLDPTGDHGLGSTFLRKVAELAFPELDRSLVDTADVTPEQPLGAAGKVDIFIEFKDTVLAIEVKIWDRSARNISASGESQLERYCVYFGEKLAGRGWKLVFLIPTFASPTCLAEFSKACQAGFEDNLKLMSWNPAETPLEQYDLPTSGIIAKSVYELLLEVITDVKRVNMPLNTQWLVDSLLEIIPDLVEEIPEPGRFPSKANLQNLPTWPIFEVFFTEAKRWPISLHTTVGVPYGVASQRSELHGNSLYRIRTVTDYFRNHAELDAYLPREAVELELWPDVWEESKNKITDWLLGLGLDESALSDDYHLDESRNEPVKLLRIRLDTKVTAEDVANLNQILREAFARLTQK